MSLVGLRGKQVKKNPKALNKQLSTEIHNRRQYHILVSILPTYINQKNIMGCRLVLADIKIHSVVIINNLVSTYRYGKRDSKTGPNA